MSKTPTTTPETPRYLDDERVAIEGKTFVFTSAEDDLRVEIPLRLRLKVLRSLSGRDLDADAMFTILAAVAPGQEEVLDELDLLEFQEVFTLWQEAYNDKAGASLGEASRSSR